MRPRLDQAIGARSQGQGPTTGQDRYSTSDQRLKVQSGSHKKKEGGSGSEEVMVTSAEGEICRRVRESADQRFVVPRVQGGVV